MRRRLVSLFAALVCSASISVAVADESPAASDGAKPQSTTGSADQGNSASVTAAKPAAPSFHPTILSMLHRNNQIRTARGMRPLRISSRLTAAAQNHARYMAATGSFSHYSNGGPSGRAATYGYRYGVRENIAMGQRGVEGAFSTWTASGAHYANLMSQSGVAGFGYAVGKNGVPYWVAVYGPEDGKE